MSATLCQNLQSEPVERLSLREAIIVRPDDSVAEAAAKMRERQLGCAVTVDDQGVAFGFFTERTLIELLLAEKNLGEEKVGRHLDPDWYTVRTSESVCEVYRRVVERGARFVCVVDDQGKPCGLTGQRGLAEYIAEHYPSQVMNQRIGGPINVSEREGG
ncbi:MAG: CBS domain-containing protein [Planctomycetales bacterium]|nr:CBS domain-containing protein [Planctomycetales bacterium]